MDGIFVDKAGGATFSGVSNDKMDDWANAHSTLLSELRNLTNKNIILNNAHGPHSGQLFERWGNPLDHDGLNLQQDIQLLRNLSSKNITALARGGGVKPGSGGDPDPVACGAALAAFLIGTEDSATDQSFFSCAVDFSSSPGKGWMTLLSDPVYSYPLGSPTGPAKTDPASGLVKRGFSGGAVAWVNESAATMGCVKWNSSVVSGTCPPGVPSTSTSLSL